MTLIVCPLSVVTDEITRSRPARILSLLSPDQAAPGGPTGVIRRVLRFHDIAEPRPGLIAPDRALVAEILAFGVAWTEPGPLLIHCWMGISRSTAAALVIACALDPARDEAELAQTLRQASPTATPNPLVVALADNLLGRDGRLVLAAASIGRGVETSNGAPFHLAVSRRSMGSCSR